MNSKLTSQDFIDATLAFEMPVFDIRFITMVKFFQAISKTGVKVILSGQGSDCINYGYYPFRHWVSKFYQEEVLTTETILGYYQNQLNELEQSLFNPSFLKKITKTNQIFLNKLLTKTQNIEPQAKRFTAILGLGDFLGELNYEDKISMFSGVEVRVPLVNKDLVDLADGCDYKMHILENSSGRYFLRQELKKHLPAKIVNRQKYPTPKKQNYFSELLEIISQEKIGIAKSSLLKSIYKPEFIENLLNKNLQILDTANKTMYGNKEDILLKFLGLYFFEIIHLA
jgi:asparagine synthetase B (glutamine-hydrolysing)